MSVKATNAYMEIVDGSGNQIDSTHPLYTSPATGSEVNVSDRAARDLGKVDIAAFDSALPAGTNLIGKVGIDQTTPGTTNGVVVTSITAGDTNIGNVDIVSLPSGNLGQQAMAASLSTVPANNITDLTYVGNVKIIDGGDITQGAKADTAVTDPAAAASTIAALKGLLTLSATSYLATTASVVIAESASLSAYFDKRGYSKLSIEMPASWTAADISFAGCSTSGGTYTPVYLAEDGIEITAETSTSRIVSIGIFNDALAAIPYLKIRSGTVGTPVVQTAAITLTVLLSR
jgi:hypothetical protein